MDNRLARKTAESIIYLQGKKYIDTKSGFLLEKQNISKVEMPVFEDSPALLSETMEKCIKCKTIILNSFLFRNFSYAVCNTCQKSESEYSLITKTEAKNTFLLTDSDLDMKESSLPYITRPNPHNSKWGSMKLYLYCQVKERALQVWNSLEAIELEKKKRKILKTQMKQKKFHKKLKVLRMQTRGSLYKKVNISHEHSFGVEDYNPATDIYTKECSTCGFIYKYEKM